MNRKKCIPHLGTTSYGKPRYDKALSIWYYKILYSQTNESLMWFPKQITYLYHIHHKVIEH